MYNENMKQTRFIPTNDCGLQLREPQEGQQESREIEGRPIVFGVRSVNLTPWSSTRKVYEILEPGCISRELLAKSDVILNLNHSNMVPDVLGRFRNSDKDTLSLELRGDGIDCRCDLPKTNNANDALELMKRGDITGMSLRGRLGGLGERRELREDQRHRGRQGGMAAPCEENHRPL